MKHIPELWVLSSASLFANFFTRTRRLSLC